MFGLEKFLAGLLLAATTVLGLFISANTRDAGFALFGYLLFVFGVLMLFRYVALLTGKEEPQP